MEDLQYLYNLPCGVYEIGWRGNLVVSEGKVYTVTDSRNGIAYTIRLNEPMSDDVKHLVLEIQSFIKTEVENKLRTSNNSLIKKRLFNLHELIFACSLVLAVISLFNLKFDSFVLLTIIWAYSLWFMFRNQEYVE